jgi:hypothetical protein
MKIIIAGAGLTGVTYALLLKQQGFKVELYEKRSIEETKKLDSVIFIKNETLKILSPFIDDDIFSKKNPKAYKEGPRAGIYEKLSIKEDHACINIDDLLLSLLDAATKNGILVHREYELQSFSRNENDTKTNVLFKHQNQTINIECDQLLLACGNRAIKPVLGNKYKHPLELHYVNVLGLRKRIDHTKDFANDNTSAIVIAPEFNFTSMIVAQIAAYYLNYCPISIGNFSLYLASLNKFVMMSTYPPEIHQALMSNSEDRVNFMRERIGKMRVNLNKLDKDFQWLAEIEKEISDQDIVQVTACSAVLLPDESLLKQGAIAIGDAFVTTPFIYGSEYNEHIQHAFPIILNYLQTIKITIDVAKNNHTQNNTQNNAKNNARTILCDSLWEFIERNDRAGKYLRAPDLLGNTMMREGCTENRVNISPFIGYSFNRKSLEILNENQQAPSWIKTSQYQDGGHLLKKENIYSNNSSSTSNNNKELARTSMEIKANNPKVKPGEFLAKCDQPSKLPSFFSPGSLGLFACAAVTVAGVAAVTSFRKPRL